MSQYTKGEWKKYGQHIHINTSNTSDEIATVLWPDWMPESEARANAHLIAAAPKMYEALKAFDHYLSAPYPHNMKLKKYATDLMEQALAKAEGK